MRNYAELLIPVHNLPDRVAHIHTTNPCQLPLLEHNQTVNFYRAACNADAVL